MSNEKKLITCECGSSFVFKNKWAHSKTKKHLDFINQSTEKTEAKPKQEDKEDKEEEDKTPINEDEDDNDDEDDDEDDEDDDSFMNELQNDVFVNPDIIDEEDKKKNKAIFEEKKRELLLEKQQFKLEQMKQKALNKPAKQQKETTADDEIFSDKPTEILGLERRILIKKINQYKLLFSTIPEVKRFKIKKKATVSDLEVALQEVQAIIETSSIDEFLSDALYESIRVVENISKAYAKRYDITGLSASLKSNPQFNSLIKQLYLKYNSYSNIPVEYQVIFTIATTAYICIQKNTQKNAINHFLNEPVGNV